MMTSDVFMMLLFICSIVTGLITEAIKKSYKNKENIVAAVVSVVVSVFVFAVYVINSGIAISTIMILNLIILVVFSWLSATLGYDKVKQSVMQIINQK